MFNKRAASYVFIDEEKEFQSRIECSISSVSGEFIIEVIEMEGSRFTQNDRYLFKTREEANAKFIEIKNSKKYNYVREFYDITTRLP